MDYTQAIGTGNELQCMLAFIKLGYTCSVPFGNSAKYDFIADVNGELLRIQCKSSHYVDDNKDAFYIDTSTSTVNTKEIKRYLYTNKDIDYFATSFINEVYLIPIDECKGTIKTLRINPPKNGKLDYAKASDYLIQKVFSEDLHYQQSKESYLNRPIKRTEPVQYKCMICGKPVTTKDSLCVECAHIESRKVDRPTREELKQLIRNNSFTELGRQYNVTDNSVRKWCKAYNLPYKVSDIRKIGDEDWDVI